MEPTIEDVRRFQDLLRLWLLGGSTPMEQLIKNERFVGTMLRTWRMIEDGPGGRYAYEVMNAKTTLVILMR